METKRLSFGTIEIILSILSGVISITSFVISLPSIGPNIEQVAEFLSEYTLTLRVVGFVFVEGFLGYGFGLMLAWISYLSPRFPSPAAVLMGLIVMVVSAWVTCFNAILFIARGTNPEGIYGFSPVLGFVVPAVGAAIFGCFMLSLHIEQTGNKEGDWRDGSALVCVVCSQGWVFAIMIVLFFLG